MNGDTEEWLIPEEFESEPNVRYLGLLRDPSDPGGLRDQIPESQFLVPVCSCGCEAPVPYLQNAETGELWVLHSWFGASNPDNRVTPVGVSAVYCLDDGDSWLRYDDEDVEQ